MKLALLLLVLLACSDATAPPQGVVGDVQGDGVVNVLDAHQVARWAAGLSVRDTLSVLRCGDADGNTVITNEDATEIARYSVGLPTFARIGREPC